MDIGRSLLRRPCGALRADRPARTWSDLEVNAQAGWAVLLAGWLQLVEQKMWPTSHDGWTTRAGCQTLSDTVVTSRGVSPVGHLTRPSSVGMTWHMPMAGASG